MANGMNDIIKGKNLEESLPQYADDMMELYYKAAFMKFTMNYYTYYEIVSEYAGESRDSIQEFLQELNRIVAQAMLTRAQGEDRQQALQCMEQLRTNVTQRVSVLTSYIDIFTRYEYILNRVEYRFREESLKPDYSDEEMAKEILRYIISDQDNAVVNQKISEVIGELPVRMVKNKFFEYVNEGVQVYSEAGKQSFDDYLYMLRSVAFLDRSQGFEEYFPELYVLYQQLEKVSFSDIERETYEEVSAKLAHIDCLTHQLVDIYTMVAELINDIYVVLLGGPYVEVSEEMEVCIRICRNICELFEKEEYMTIDEETENLIISLEGKPEKIGFECASAEYVVDIVKENYVDEAERVGCGEIYAALFLCEKLMSGSLFVELEDTKPDDTLTPEYFEAQKKKLLEDLALSFEGRDKMMNRAVMGIVLSLLPVFFQNMEEVKAYVLAALDNCRDEAEKLGCIQLIHMMIAGE